MEQVNQITQLAIDTDNKWFLQHDITKIALIDLKVKKRFSLQK